MEDFFHQSYLMLNMIIAIASGVFLFLFLFLHTPISKNLQNYRICRKYISIAYFITFVFSTLNYLASCTENKFTFLTALSFSLIIASFQALLMPVALITLINSNYQNLKKVRIVKLIILGFSILTLFQLCSFVTLALSAVILKSFLAFFVFQLCWGVREIRLESGCIQKQMDNYFGDTQANQLKWIKTSFYLTISSGFMAIPIFLSSNWFLYTLFALYYSVIYIYVTIKYLNYPVTFKLIGPLLASSSAADNMENTLAQADIDKAINKWIQHKLFITPGLTIQDLAMQLGTNRTYLSNYINNDKQQNFNSWINHLRIAEAKKLLINNPQLPITQVGERVGYTDPSVFARQFMKHTGQSASNWRRQHN